MQTAISFRKHGFSMIKQNIAEAEEDILYFALPEVYMPIVFFYFSNEHTRRTNLIKKLQGSFSLLFK